MVVCRQWPRSWRQGAMLGSSTLSSTVLRDSSVMAKMCMAGLSGSSTAYGAGHGDGHPLRPDRRRHVVLGVPRVHQIARTEGQRLAEPRVVSGQKSDMRSHGGAPGRRRRAAPPGPRCGARRRRGGRSTRRSPGGTARNWPRQRTLSRRRPRRRAREPNAVPSDDGLPPGWGSPSAGKVLLHRLKPPVVGTRWRGTPCRWPSRGPGRCRPVHCDCSTSIRFGTGSSLTAASVRDSAGPAVTADLAGRSPR